MDGILGDEAIILNCQKRQVPENGEGTVCFFNVGLVRVSSWSTWVFKKTRFIFNAVCCVSPFVVGGESNRNVLSCLFPDAVFGVQASITLAVSSLSKGNMFPKYNLKSCLPNDNFETSDKKWTDSNPTYWVEVSDVLQQHPGHFWSLR